METDSKRNRDTDRVLRALYETDIVLQDEFPGHTRILKLDELSCRTKYGLRHCAKKGTGSDLNFLCLHRKPSLQDEHERLIYSLDI